MSFVRLDSGEFPPLGSAVINTRESKQQLAISNHDRSTNNESKSFKKVCTTNTKKANKNSNGICNNQSISENLSHSSSAWSIDNSEFDEPENIEVPLLAGTEVTKCRVGLQLKEFNMDLSNILKKEKIGIMGDFVITPIEGTRVELKTNNPYPNAVELSKGNNQQQISLLPDLALTCELWQTKIALELKYPTQGTENSTHLASHFERVFTHALYLSAPIIIVSCPDSEAAYVSMAAVINRKLGPSKQAFRLPLVLVRVSISDEKNNLHRSWICDTPVNGMADNPRLAITNHQKNLAKDTHNGLQDSQGSLGQCKSGDSFVSTSSESDYNTKGKISNSSNAWRQWNAIRSHLDADVRIGVCLSIDDDLSEHNQYELARWAGEPVRLVTLNINQFSRSPHHSSMLCLPLPCLDFVKSIIYGNSLNTSLAIQGTTNQNVREYLTYLRDLTSSIKESDTDRLREWDDRIQPPLQPLSVNLDAGTYQVFESDATKYISYRSAMREALHQLVYNLSVKKRKQNKSKFILMVLGAGRGPLVDAFIQAIKELDNGAQFKIYALEKNPCSVQSLLYKQKTEWKDLDDLIETEIIESDMRTWEPGVKADIIASELLGSLGDNELSPECLDGTFRLSTSDTISIPQEYTSWIEPISSYKLYQELCRIKEFDSLVFDQIYVTRLTNCYKIDEVQPLFHFEHKDLSLSPSMRDNNRYTNAIFWSKVDTVCHGFGGYFSANLYGKQMIATVPHMKTRNMESWFPVFIPFERPVQMPKGSRLEVHFWRKESTSKVWYEWAITSPERSRIHGLKSAMSKSI